MLFRLPLLPGSCGPCSRCAVLAKVRAAPGTHLLLPSKPELVHGRGGRLQSHDHNTQQPSQFLSLRCKGQCSSLNCMLVQNGACCAWNTALLAWQLCCPGACCACVLCPSEDTSRCRQLCTVLVYGHICAKPYAGSVQMEAACTVCRMSTGLQH